MSKPAKLSNPNQQSVIVSYAMIERGAELLMFYDPEFDDREEYAKKLYLAMVAESDDAS